MQRQSSMRLAAAAQPHPECLATEGVAAPIPAASRIPARLGLAAWTDESPGAAKRCRIRRAARTMADTGIPGDPVRGTREMLAQPGVGVSTTRACSNVGASGSTDASACSRALICLAPSREMRIRRALGGTPRTETEQETSPRVARAAESTCSRSQSRRCRSRRKRTLPPAIRTMSRIPTCGPSPRAASKPQKKTNAAPPAAYRRRCRSARGEWSCSDGR